LHAGQFTLLVNQTDIVPLFVYILESPKLTLFTLQLDQVDFYTLSLTDHQSTKPAARTHSFSDVVPDTWAAKASGDGGQASGDAVKLSP
jgi:hypothetical protein